MDLDLKKIRDDYNLTQTELGKKLGLTLRTIQNYENGTPIPDAVQKLIQYEFFSHQNQVSEPMQSYKPTNVNAMENVNWTRNDIDWLRSQIDEKQKTIDFLQNLLITQNGLNNKKQAG